jgi:acyl-homoserine-lactone acylase
MNLTSLYNIDTTVHKDLAETISRLRNWNGKSTVKDTSASLMAVFGVYFSDYLGANMAPYENYFSDSSLLKILRQSRDYLLKNHGTLDVPLGQIQKVRRGDKEFPMYGGIETLACCTVGFDKDGILKMNKGDTYIMYAKYGADGLEALRTTNYVGNSSNPLSKHYNDQMEMYVNKQPKTITMNKDEIYKNAVSVSHPE